MKTSAIRNRGGHVRHSFPASAFFGFTLMITAIFAGIVFFTGHLLGFRAFLLEQHTAVILLCLLLGLSASSLIADRRERWRAPG